MKYYVNDGLAITHGGKMFTAGKEFPAETLGEEHVKVLLKEGSLIEEKAYKKKFGPTEEELKAKAEAKDKAEAKEKATADAKVKAKAEAKDKAEAKEKATADAKVKAKAEADKMEELRKIAAELGIKKANKMKKDELIEAIELAKAEIK